MESEDGFREIVFQGVASETAADPAGGQGHLLYDQAWRDTRRVKIDLIIEINDSEVPHGHDDEHETHEGRANEQLPKEVRTALGIADGARVYWSFDGPVTPGCPPCKQDPLEVTDEGDFRARLAEAEADVAASRA